MAENGAKKVRVAEANAPAAVTLAAVVQKRGCHLCTVAYVSTLCRSCSSDNKGAAGAGLSDDASAFLAAGLSDDASAFLAAVELWVELGVQEPASMVWEMLSACEVRSDDKKFCDEPTLPLSRSPRVLVRRLDRALSLPIQPDLRSAMAVSLCKFLSEQDRVSAPVTLPLAACLTLMSCPLRRASSSSAGPIEAMAQPSKKKP
jgi:hypothetical protein